MTIDEPMPPNVDTAGRHPQLTVWIEKARANEGFAVFLAILAIVLTIAMWGMHGSTYGHTVRNGGLAAAGGLLDVLASVAAATGVGLVYGKWPRRRWIIAASSATVLILFFTLLPPLTAHYGWLTVLLFVLVTLACEAVLTMILLLIHPWTWIHTPFN